MPDARSEENVELYEHFFCDPRVGNGVLQPSHKGLACRNIRDAMRYLGYSLAGGDTFDGELQKVIATFQADQGHKSQDGHVGPGTRKLLTNAILAQGTGFFRRGRISPEYAVFLSYSRKDEAVLAGLIDGLRSRGIPVFRDKDAIPAGASWPEVLFRSIRKCQVMLCVLSTHSADSINVLIEVALARHAERPIIPILLQPLELPIALLSLLGDFQHLDLSDKSDPAEGLDEVLESLLMYGVKQLV